MSNDQLPIQRDLLRKDYHAIFVMRDGSKSDVLMFDSRPDMSAVMVSKMKLDKEKYAYAMGCWWNGSKVIMIAMEMGNTKGAK